MTAHDEPYSAVTKTIDALYGSATLVGAQLELPVWIFDEGWTSAAMESQCEMPLRVRTLTAVIQMMRMSNIGPILTR